MGPFNAFPFRWTRCNEPACATAPEFKGNEVGERGVGGVILGIEVDSPSNGPGVDSVSVSDERENHAGLETKRSRRGERWVRIWSDVGV